MNNGGSSWPNKTALRRIIELDRLIRDGVEPTTEELAERFEVTARTIYRDLAYLRDQLGAPLAYRRRRSGRGGYYYSDANYILPAGLIRHGEMVGLLLAGRLVEQTPGQPKAAPLAALIERLRGILDERELLLVQSELAAFDYAARRTRRIDARVVEAAARALRHRRRVRLDLYAPADGRWRRLEFEGYRVVHLNNNWYLLGRRVENEELDALPLARVKGLEPLEERYCVPREFALEEVLGDAFGFRLGAAEYRVALVFEGASARRVAEREWHPSQRLSFGSDGRLRLTLRTAHLEELTRWLAGFGGEVRVESPPELRRLLIDHAERLAAANHARTPLDRR